MQMPNSAKVVPSRSTPVLWRTAEAMATGKAMVSEMAMASSASCTLGRMRDEDHRQLVLEDLGHLAEDLLALGLGADFARAVEQRIELRVRNARPVERGARRGLEELIDVAVGIGAAAPLEADHLEVL